VGLNWNVEAFTNGAMANFYASVREAYPVDGRTAAWQDGMIRNFNRENVRRRHESQWRQLFGDVRFPPLNDFPHHYVHAFQACLQSPFETSLCLTMDGSGDEHCTVVWLHEGDRITPLREILIPHSLGWLYAAMTEYLGFQAYNGEYKVMGLAAYGRPNRELREKVERIVTPAPDGIEYRVDPSYIHFGEHTWSARYTDKLVELFGRHPRLAHEEITSWHEDLAYAVQQNLEDSAERLVLWAVGETGVHRLCMSGGCALNIKMNSRLYRRPEIEDIFINPLCSDGGAAVGAALAANHRLDGSRPQPLESLALGWEESDADIEKVLQLTGVDYSRPADICEAAAEELAAGRIGSWFQGRMEAGPRALGQRSILADPRAVENRDRVNAIIKFREYWRPFCPSMLHEAAADYFDDYTEAPFMILSFVANEKLKRDAPAIVHVDGTSRVQLVKREVLPAYHALIAAFARRTGVPVVLNTSFNVKGEPIVCTIHDALRTFWATGLDVLAAGSFLIRKPRVGR